MKPLKSKYGAQADTRHCLEGIPASWWIKYKGKRIVEILQELQRNTISCPGINSRVHHSTSALLRKGKEPPHMRFLAMLLARGSLPLQGHMLEILMEEDMGSLASWDDSDDPDPPTPDDSIDVWEAWAAAVTARLWPDEAELRRLLSPAQQAFRKATLGLEVTEVRRAELHWRIPSHDINLNADALEKHFTEIAAGNDGQLDSETVSQPNARGGWDLRHKNAGRPMGSVGGTAPADVIDDEDYEDGPRLSNRLKRKSGTRAEIEDQRDYLSEDPEDAWSELEGPQVIPTMFQSSDSKSRDLSYKGQRAAVPLQRDVITRKRARTLLSPELGEAHPSIRAKQRDTSSSEQDQDQDQVDLQHVYQVSLHLSPVQTDLASNHPPLRPPSRQASIQATSFPSVPPRQASPLVTSNLSSPFRKASMTTSPLSPPSRQESNQATPLPSVPPRQASPLATSPPSPLYRQASIQGESLPRVPPRQSLAPSTCLPSAPSRTASAPATSKSLTPHALPARLS
ncbi:hypothetical protein IMZ48_12990 [Candidatus Bathyarchaeota archaeon]|nr:hypothetical protein [Candidatus Bathyarchaeota archaeon]